MHEGALKVSVYKGYRIYGEDGAFAVDAKVFNHDSCLAHLILPGEFIVSRVHTAHANSRIASRTINFKFYFKRVSCLME